MIKLNLQLFADAGTFVNAIPNTVNAYTGAVHDTRSAAELAALNHDYWVEELLDNMRDEFIFTQLGDAEPLPQNSGTTINWTRVPPLADADVLVEGVIPQGKRLSVESINATLVRKLACNALVAMRRHRILEIERGVLNLDQHLPGREIGDRFFLDLSDVFFVFGFRDHHGPECQIFHCFLLGLVVKMTSRLNFRWTTLCACHPEIRWSHGCFVQHVVQ